MTDGWLELGRTVPAWVVVDGVELRRGSRVRLHPRPGADVIGLAVAGRAAIVDRVEEDMEGALHLAVVLEDDPGDPRRPGRRLFFAPDEVVPLAGAPLRHVLVAGIGNVFMGDDGFGVEVARRLAERPVRPGVEVRDFGIRGMDLVYALQDYDVAIFVDATPRGAAPGTLHVIEPELSDEVSLDTHGMDPVRVLGLARELGPVPERLLVVGCEPAGDEELTPLSAPVEAALDAAVELVESLLDKEASP
ncbi:MAG TPA: hydrogenase maturation protease [Solirubrobacter sp.]|nr:hydrogenase maturation protease [Solirubrobacter sp.]